MQAHEAVAQMEALKNDLDVMFALTPPEDIERRDQVGEWIATVISVIDYFRPAE